MSTRIYIPVFLFSPTENVSMKVNEWDKSFISEIWRIAQFKVVKEGRFILIEFVSWIKYI